MPADRPAQGSRTGCDHGAAGVLRCDCGSLLARYVGGHVELKCRRCKRTVLVPVEPPEDATS